MSGFWIKTISAQSATKKPASIELKPGANIISGPSDTGKSYIFSIVNFVLGRSSPPKNIREGIGYTKFLLEIVTYSENQSYMLSRELEKNKVEVKDLTTKEITTYNTKGLVSAENHLSNFLLSLCNLNNIKLLKNKTKGEKINLSFKNLIQLTNISESRIITESSPFYFTQIHINRMMEQSLISSILEGTDFSNVTSIEDPKKIETRISGKLELIDKQIIEYTEERIEVESLIKAKPSEWEFDLNEINQKLSNKINEGKALQSQIDEIVKELAFITEQSIYNRELNSRFKILKRQYLSDHSRLSFILEAESIIEQLPSHLCPICSNPIENNQLQHIKELDDFKESVNVEKELIILKIKELEPSIFNTETEYDRLIKSESKYTEQLNQINKNLSEINPEIEALKSVLVNLLSSEKLNNRIEFIDNVMEKLYSDKDKLERAKSDKKETDVVNICDYDLLKELSSYIEKRLKAWNYNENPKVIFNSETNVFDIVISSKSRGSFGKGRRAISYSACVLGFLDYCRVKNRDFHNFVILDSPLTTFRDAVESKEDQSALEIERHFFENVGSKLEGTQIIIIDNKAPSNTNDFNMVTFTKNEQIGRYGFIPN
ncbi:MAG: AAA family ATPase [Saprospiraceae bacterium]|nr:AAA family ATPase [Saprospiraceae bacterium]